jgi:hypothetical protein
VEQMPTYEQLLRAYKNNQKEKVILRKWFIRLALVGIASIVVTFIIPNFVTAVLAGLCTLCCLAITLD